MRTKESIQATFWFTRPSLVNLCSAAGFSSVYECFVPTHMNFGRPGIEAPDRCTFVALKGDACQLITSPDANHLREEWPENSLSYAAPLGETEPAVTSISAKAESVFRRLRRGRVVPSRK